MGTLGGAKLTERGINQGLQHPRTREITAKDSPIVISDGHAISTEVLQALDPSRETMSKDSQNMYYRASLGRVLLRPKSGNSISDSWSHKPRFVKHHSF